MRLHRLELKNIGCHRELALDFGPGIIGFTGPNGSGKSTVLDAICFAVTGESRQAGVLVDNLTWGATAGSVRLSFTHGDTPYIIERRIGRRSGALLQMGDQQLIKAAEIREYIEGILNTSTQALLDNVFVPQKKIEEIFTMRRGERLQEIQRTVGLIRASQAYDALGDELASLQVTVGLDEQIAAAKNGLDNSLTEELAARDQLSRLEAEIRDLTPAKELLLRAEELRRASAAIRAAEAEIEGAQLELQDAERRRLRAHDDLSATETVAEQLRPVAESARKSIVQYESSKRAHAKAMAVHAEFERVEKELAALGERPDPTICQDLDRRLAECSSAVVLRKDQLSGAAPRPWMAQEIELQRRLDEVLAKRKEPEPSASDEEVRLVVECQRLQKNLKVFATGACPTCGTPSTCPNCHHQLYDFDLAASQREHKEAQQKLEAMKMERLSSWRNRVAAMDREVTVLKERLNELDTIATGVLRKALATARQQQQQLEDAVTAARKRLQTWDNLVIKRDAMKGQLPEIGEEPEPVDLEALQLSVSRYEVVRGKIMELQSVLKVCDQQTRGAQARLERATAARAQFSGAEAPIAAEVEEDARRQVALLLTREEARKRLIDTLTSSEIRREQYEVMLRRLQQQQRDEAQKRDWAKRCKRVRDILHVREFPTLIMRECARRLNERVAYYQRVWEAPFSLRLNGELDFEAELQDGFPISAARLSGGQSVVGALSFRWAMVDTFARQAGLLVLDEPTNHLDQRNVELLQRLLQRLKELSGATGRQVFVVTHVEALVGFFDQAFSFQGGQS